MADEQHSSMTMLGDILASADSTHDIGDSTNFFANAYLDNIVFDSELSLTVDATNELLHFKSSAGSGKVGLKLDNTGFGEDFSIELVSSTTWKMGGVTNLQITTNTSLQPQSDSNANLGSSSKFWLATYTDKIFLDADSTIEAADVDNFQTAFTHSQDNSQAHSDYLLNTGDIGTGVYDFGGADSFEIPNSATPTVDAAGEIAIDTTITDHTALIRYFGAEELIVIAVPTDKFNAVNGNVIAYNAANNEFEMTTAAGGGDVTGDTASADKEFVRFNGTGGKTIESPVTDDASTTATLSDTADVTFYDANNDGNPVFSYGSSATNRLTIIPTYGSGAQTIEFVEFKSLSSSATADFGEFRFSVDETLVATIDDGGVEIRASGSLSFGAVDILTDSTGTTTLSNIDVIDSTTGAAIEADIEHDNLQSIPANDHIDHSGVTITAGDGLSGGGTIESTRTLTVDLNELGTESTIDAGVDFLAMVDATDSGSQKILAEDIPVGYDTETAIASGDFVIMVDITDNNAGKITFANFEGDLAHNNLIAGTIVSHDTDATGAELTELTDSSETTLHSHAGGGGATTALDNLSSVAINLSLVSDTDITDDLGTGDIRWRDTYTETVRAGLTANDTLKLEARDVDGSSWTTFLTLTSANTPTADLAAAVTINSNAIAFAGGAFHDGFSDFVGDEHLDWTASVGTIHIDNIADASVSAQGVIEVATAAETTTGTDAARSVSPDSLAGSEYGERGMQIVVYDWTVDVATGNGQYYFHIDGRLGGMDLVDIHAEVIDAGTTGNLDIQIHNLTQTADMLSTVMRIETGETGTDTSAQPGTIDGDNDDVVENDIIRIDIDDVQSTAPKGLFITMGFRLP